MNAVAVWRALRVVRWGLWLGTIAYYAYFAMFRADHLNAFGHLLLRTEMFMFGLPIAAMFVGLLELWAREGAGAPRPSLFGGSNTKAGQASSGASSNPTGIPR